MTDEQETTRKEPHTPFEGMPFAPMMEKIVGQQGIGCGCAEMMSQMMAMCRGAGSETEEATQEHEEAQNVNQ